MRVAFLGPCPVSSFKKYLKLRDERPDHPSTWIMNLAGELVKLGVELHYISQSDKIEKSESLRDKGVTYHFVKRPAKYNVHTLFQFDKWRLHKKLKDVAPELVHSHGTEDAYSYAAVTSNYKSLISIQGIIAHLAETPHAPRRFKLVKFIERFTLKKGKYFIAKTPFAEAFIRGINPKAKIYAVENPIKFDYFQLEPALASGRILYIGNINAAKGIEDLLRAVKLAQTQCPAKNVTLRVIGNGDGGYLERLEGVCKELKIDSQVEFLGFLPPEEVVREMEQAAALVLPSYMETSPNCVAEAMAAGVPVISTSVGGIPFMVKDGITGLLSAAGDLASLAGNIARLLNEDDLRRKMGSAGKVEARKRYFPETAAKKMLTVYEEMLSEGLDKGLR